MVHLLHSLLSFSAAAKARKTGQAGQSGQARQQPKSLFIPFVYPAPELFFLWWKSNIGLQANPTMLPASLGGHFHYVVLMVESLAEY